MFGYLIVKIEQFRGLTAAYKFLQDELKLAQGHLNEMQQELVALREPVSDDPHQPAPDTVALAIMQALLSTGQYEVPVAAIQSAWALVPQYYIEREKYARDIAPKYFNSINDPIAAGEMAQAMLDAAIVTGTNVIEPSSEDEV